MKSNELFEKIHWGEIKEDTQIDVINELTEQYITTIEYRNGMLNWEPGEFDTSFLCNSDIDFVVKENKEIDTINAYKLLEEPYLSDCFKREKFDEAAKMLKQSELEIIEVVNNLVYAVKELIEEREKK